MKIDNFQIQNADDATSVRTVHIHPSTVCNQSCKHCYSNSSPFNRKRELDASSLSSFLEYAWQEGFNTVAVSGGEPFVYSGLEELVSASKEIGYNVSINTNGTLLKSSRAKRVLPLIDDLALSIDGTPMVHNEVRNDDRAFEKVLEGIEIAEKYAGKYGIVHTLTSKSWDSLLWFGEFAYENSASYLKIHPLEITGRAAIEMLMLELDQITLHKVYFLTNYMQNKYGKELQLMLDLVHKNYIEKNPSVVSVYPQVKNYGSEPLANTIKSIVIDENGDIVPLSYGFSRQYIIGNVHYFEKDEDIFGGFMKSHGKDLKNFFMQAYWKMVNDKDHDLYNVEDFLTAESLRAEVSENVA